MGLLVLVGIVGVLKEVCGSCAVAVGAGMDVGAGKSEDGRGGEGAVGTAACFCCAAGKRERQSPMGCVEGNGVVVEKGWGKVEKCLRGKLCRNA